MSRVAIADITVDQIKQACHDTGLGRKEIAERLNISVHAVNGWIARGRIPKGQLRKLQLLKLGEVGADTGLKSKILSNATDAELADELSKRNWIVTLKRNSLQF